MLFSSIILFISAFAGLLYIVTMHQYLYNHIFDKKTFVEKHYTFLYFLFFGIYNLLIEIYPSFFSLPMISTKSSFHAFGSELIELVLILGLWRVVWDYRYKFIPKTWLHYIVMTIVVIFLKLYSIVYLALGDLPLNNNFIKEVFIPFKAFL